MDNKKRFYFNKLLVMKMVSDNNKNFLSCFSLHGVVTSFCRPVISPKMLSFDAGMPRWNRENNCGMLNREQVYLSPSGRSCLLPRPLKALGGVDNNGTEPV